MEKMKSRQCEYIFKVRIYFEATGFSYELNVGCETKKGVKDDHEVFNQTKKWDCYLRHWERW